MKLMEFSDEQFKYIWEAITAFMMLQNRHRYLQAILFMAILSGMGLFLLYVLEAQYRRARKKRLSKIFIFWSLLSGIILCLLKKISLSNVTLVVLPMAAQVALAVTSILDLYLVSPAADTSNDCVHNHS